MLDMAEFFLDLRHGAGRDSGQSFHQTLFTLRSRLCRLPTQRHFLRTTVTSGPAKPTTACCGRLNLRISGILSSSTFPLRLAAYLFPLLVSLNIALLLWGPVRRAGGVRPSVRGLHSRRASLHLSGPALTRDVGTPRGPSASSTGGGPPLNSIPNPVHNRVQRVGFGAATHGGPRRS